MDATVGRENDALTFFRDLADGAYRFDFYGTLRRVECLHADKPRLGSALRPVDEPVRLGQEPDLSFAPSPLAACEIDRDGTPPRIQVRLFGLLGPNGPLPLHITDYTRERLRQSGDATLSRFLNLFNHRFLAMFYRAWAQAQPHVNHDRPDADRFLTYVGALVGISPPAFKDLDTVPDVAKLFHAGALIRQTRGPEGLVAIIRQFFHVSVRIEEFVGHWLPLGPRERTYLARQGAVVGAGAVIGARVWDRQHKFRIHLGPLSFREYQSFLPGSPRLRQLVDWVRLYLGFELQWDVRLKLASREVPRLKLGRPDIRLGWTSWLGRRPTDADADDLCVDADAFVASTGGATG